MSTRSASPPSIASAVARTSPKPDRLRVSVIVVLFNGARFISSCLRSVLLNRDVPFEVLVVDNASTDDGPEQVAREFPQVRLIRSASNRGYAGGINLGLREARGSLIAPLNMDTEVASDWLLHLVAALDAQREVAAVTPLVLLAHARTRVNAAGGAIHLSGVSFCRGLGRPVEGIPPDPFEVPGLSGVSYLVRRSALDALGGAPAWCFMGNDDVVLSWQLRLLGGRILCVPGARVFHHYHLTLNPDKLCELERNRLALLASALELGTGFSLAPLLLSTEGAILAYCLWKGEGWLEAKRQAYRAVLGALPEILERRRRLQQLRRVSDWEVLKRLEWGMPLDQLRTLAGEVPVRAR